MKAIRNAWDKTAFALIMALAGFLSVFNIWNLGYSNEFYAASVKSMLTGWKNFFFASLDPGGWVTVDKPPVSLWVQTAFAKVFGFYGWSIILPQCLAAMAAVAIVYHVVKRHFGSLAGLISALVLAISPIFIVVSKTNNTDSVLIFFMTLSAWAMMAASDTGRLRYLLLSMALLGVAYNAKTLEAFLILPALYATYFFATNLKWKTRLWHLLVATVVLAVVSLSWSVIVDMTPASERPYVDNSTNNSELELALGYNGIQRITGQSRGGSGRTGISASSPNSGNTGSEQDGEDVAQGMPNGFQGQTGGNTSSGVDGTAQDSSGTVSSSDSVSSGSAGSSTDGRDSRRDDGGSRDGFTGGGNMGGGNNMFNGGGSPSILRMFNTTLGGQDSWMLPFGLLSILALALGMRKSREEDAETRRKLLRNLLLWGGSVTTMVGYFSVAQFFHPYYISAMAPFLAALVGVGFTQMAKLYRKDGAAGYLLPIALAATLAVQSAMLLSYPAFSKYLIPAACVLTGVPALVLFIFRAARKDMGKKLVVLCMAAGLAGLLIAPAVWTSYSVFRNSFNSAIPTAGPSEEGSSMFGQTGGRGGMTGLPSGGETSFGDGGQNSSENGNSGNSGGGFGDRSDSSSEALIAFLEKNNTGEKWLVAVPSASEAEPIILATGKPVMAIGGFSGNDNTLTVEKLEEMVKAGEIKYFMVGGRGGMGGSSSDEVTQWVEQNGTAVDSSVWSSSSSGLAADGRTGSSQTLYDLSAYKNK